MHVDFPGLPDHRRPDARTGEERAKEAAPTRADDELRRVDAPREVDKRTRDVFADDLVETAAEGFDEGPLGREDRRVGTREPVGSGDVHSEELPSA